MYHHVHRPRLADILRNKNNVVWSLYRKSKWQIKMNGGMLSLGMYKRTHWKLLLIHTYTDVRTLDSCRNRVHDRRDWIVAGYVGGVASHDGKSDSVVFRCHFFAVAKDHQRNFDAAAHARTGTSKGDGLVCWGWRSVHNARRYLSNCKKMFIR